MLNPLTDKQDGQKDQELSPGVDLGQLIAELNEDGNLRKSLPQILVSDSEPPLQVKRSSTSVPKTLSNNRKKPHRTLIEASSPTPPTPTRHNQLLSSSSDCITPSKDTVPNTGTIFKMTGSDPQSTPIVLRKLTQQDQESRNQQSQKDYNARTQALAEAEARFLAKQMERDEAKKRKELQVQTKPEDTKEPTKNTTRPNPPIDEKKKKPTPNPPPFWRRAFTCTAYAALFGAAMWGVPNVAKKLASVAASYEYTRFSEHILASEGKVALYSLPFLSGVALCRGARKSGAMALLLTSAISGVCSYKEGNIYPGILGLAGIIIDAISGLLSNHKSDHKPSHQL